MEQFRYVAEGVGLLAESLLPPNFRPLWFSMTVQQVLWDIEKVQLESLHGY
jgi:hypothetical protein